jgi:hypothetical protein
VQTCGEIQMWRDQSVSSGEIYLNDIHIMKYMYPEHTITIGHRMLIHDN